MKRADRPFCPDLLPEYMLTGHEVCYPSHIEIDPAHRWLFDLVLQHPQIFTGFFHYDLAGNVRPKLEVLRQHGFYPSPQSDRPQEGTESCGAHSPRVAPDPRRELFTRPT